MGGLKLEIPDEVLRSLKLPPGEVELRKELALALYRRGVLSLGKARELVGMTRWQFEELLGERRIVRHYTEKDLDEDLAYVRIDRNYANGQSKRQEKARECTGLRHKDAVSAIGWAPGEKLTA